MRACQKNPKIRARYEGLTEGKPPRFTGTVRIQPDSLSIPLRVKKPTTFAIWNDLFHSGVPAAFILAAWGQMRRCPQHTFIILTKRPQNMAEFVEGLGVFNYNILPNIWLGVTVENNKHLDRINDLLQIPAAVHFVSVEPMLSAVGLRRFLLPGFEDVIGIFRDDWKKRQRWVICGGETGPGARPLDPDWACDLRDQCQGAGVPFFFKSHGEWKTTANREWPNPNLLLASNITFTSSERVGKKRTGRLLDGREHNEYPGVRKA